MTMSGKSVVILGAGTGGLVAATTLRKLLGREHRVVLVDRSEDHVFAPSFLWLMLGQRRPERIRRPLARLARKGIDFRRAQVQALDLPSRVVKTTDGDLPYDYLVVALGAETDMTVIPGLAQAAHDLYDLQGVRGLRDALETFRGGRVVVLVSRLPYKCPGAPYEAAMLLESYFRQRGIRDKVELALYAPEPAPMPVAGPELGAAVAGSLAQRGIPYFPQWVVTAVDPQARCIRFESGETVPFDLLVAIPPHRCPAVVRASGLTGDAAWVPVDPATLRTAFNNVYALGDITAIKLANGMMLPKAGVFAHGQAETVARNIAAAIGGRPVDHRFAGHGYCFLEMGGGAAGFASGNFYAAPNPAVKMRRPGRLWHWGKVAFEKWWLRHWF